MKHTFKHNPRPKGLGDTVEKITKATGLKSITDLAMNGLGVKDCGCNKRKKWLNEKFPYKNKEK